MHLRGSTETNLYEMSAKGWVHTKTGFVCVVFIGCPTVLRVVLLTVVNFEQYLPALIFFFTFKSQILLRANAITHQGFALPYTNHNIPLVPNSEKYQRMLTTFSNRVAHRRKSSSDNAFYVRSTNRILNNMKEMN